VANCARDVTQCSGWGGLAVSLGKRRSMILAAVLVVAALACLGLVINDLMKG
jgi:hypothetical protein